MPARKPRIKSAPSFCHYMNSAQSPTLLHLLVYMKPTALFFVPLYSDLNTHNILQIKLNTRAHSFQHLASVQNNNRDMYKWKEQVDCPVICCSVYVYIPNHVPPRTLRHTLKMARSHPASRSSSSTLRQLRQHESPCLVRASRSRIIAWNTRVRTLRTDRWNTDWNWSPKKKGVYQSIHLNNRHKSACLSGLLLQIYSPSSIMGAKYQA